MPGRPSGAMGAGQLQDLEALALPPSECSLVLPTPRANLYPLSLRFSYSLSPRKPISAECIQSGKRGRHLPPTTPRTHKQTKEIQLALLSGFPETRRIPGALSLRSPPPARSSESRSETTASGGTGPGGRGCWREARGGRDRFLKYCLLSSEAREACDWRPLPRAGRRRGLPGGRARAPGAREGSPERSNPFWAGAPGSKRSATSPKARFSWLFERLLP